MASRKESAHVGLMRPGSKIAFHRMGEGRAPWVSPPSGMIVAQVLLLGWLAIELAVVLLDRTLSETLDNSAAAMLAAICFGALGPILISYGIATNRFWARHLLLVTVAGIGFLLWLYLDIGRSSSIVQGVVACIFGLGLLVLIWYLYFSHSVRSYYCAIEGRVLPAESNADAEPMEIERSVASGSRFQLLLEFAVIFLGLAVFVAAYLTS